MLLEHFRMQQMRKLSASCNDVALFAVVHAFKHVHVQLMSWTLVFCVRDARGFVSFAGRVTAH